MARPPSFDRHKVLSTVERQFRKTSYAGTSMDDIAAATGLGRGSLYAAFGDKRNLFLQAFGGYCDRNEASLLTALAGPDSDALDRLHWFLGNAVALIFDDDDQLGCMTGKFAVELCGRDVEIGDRIKQDLSVMQQALIECVRAAQRNGDLDPAVKADEIAGLIIAVTRGIDVIAQAGGQAPQLQAIADRAFAGLPLTAQANRRLTRA
jgi:TetR/AcrR family transcriptional regulator, transcriptional repressor for nem operon